MERLQTGFADYNGRYLGNLTVMILTRLPSALRAFIELTLICLFFGCVFVFLKKAGAPLLFFLCLFFSMPLEIFTQTVTWTAGFSNFFLSALFVTFILSIDLSIVESPDHKAPVPIWLFSVFVFAGQFYLENAALYTIVLTMAAALMCKLRFGKIPNILFAQFVAALAGALIMFSNGAYFSAATDGEETYKRIHIQHNIFSLIHSVLTTFKYVIVKKWFGINSTANLLLSLTLCVYCFLQRKKLFFAIGVGFAAIFTYNVIFSENRLFSSLTFLCLLSFLFILYIIFVSLLLVKSSANLRLLFLSFSVLMLMAPLTVAEPLTERCFFNSYICWALLAAEFLRLILDDFSKKWLDCQRAFLISAGLYLLICLSFLTAGQKLSWEIEDVRMNAISKHLSYSEEERPAQLVLPSVPKSDLYCYGANPEGEYWFNNYKEFYGIDSSVELVFVNYEVYNSSE